MDQKVQQQDGLALVDRHISDLEMKLNALQDLILAMIAAGGDTTHQSEMLLKMIRTRSALKAFRQELAEDVQSPDSAQPTE